VPTTTVGGRLFEAANPWNTDISTLPKSGTSDGIIQALDAAGGWGTGTFRIDFSIEVLESDATTPFRTFTPTSDFYTPDCDHVPFPVPPGGAIEGETGYQCVSDGDCHLIVVHRPTKTLYEMWRANITSSTFFGGCAAVWDLTRAYPTTLRGDQCSSSDAGGFPIAAMLFSADEVARGSIDHAIRFILPNSRMRAGVYVRPASHAGGPSGGSSLPPYGVRFRLRSDFPLASLPNEGARVIARAMQRYGMILSDGGNIALTAQSDRFTTHKWSEVGVGSYALQAIKVTDMEVVGMGTPVPLTYDCVRNP
jgi:serine/threonine-protein kinase